MRVIAGSVKGRRLKAVPGREVRPTADRVKEALYSIVGSRFELAGTTILDLFAGTGGLGIEALSRGAARVVFVEQDRAVARVLGANLTRCGFLSRAEIWPMSVRRALRELARAGARFDGVCVDPPYGRAAGADTLERLAAGNLLRAGAWVAVERHVDDRLADAYGALRLTRARRYGNTILALFCIAEVRDQVATP